MKLELKSWLDQEEEVDWMRGSAKVLAAALVVLLAGWTAPAAGDPGGLCTWGGTPDAQTGVFSVNPGVRYVPSTQPLDFAATGELAGDDSACAGTMTFAGELATGASCRFFLNEGTVSGVPGFERYADAGTAYSHGFIFGSGDSVLATFNALVVPGPDTIGACASEQGLTQAAFSSVVVLLR